MNALATVNYDRPPAPRPHRFTLDDVIALREAGVLHPEIRVELLDGEIIDMPSEGELHAGFMVCLTRTLVLSVSDDLAVVPGSRLSLAPNDAPVPDLYVMEAAAPLVLTPPARVKLVLEISDSSQAQDMGRKAAKYGTYGIADYWVVDVRHEVTHVHREPQSGGYGERRAVPFNQPLRPLLLPTVEIVIAELMTVRPGETDGQPA